MFVCFFLLELEDNLFYDVGAVALTNLAPADQSPVLVYSSAERDLLSLLHRCSKGKENKAERFMSNRQERTEMLAS